MNKKLNSYDDKMLASLLKGSKEDKADAFTEIYQRYSSVVHAYCSKVFNNYQQAEDIFQETFIKFYQDVKIDLNSRINIPGLLITIARNLCLNYKRGLVATVSLDGMDFKLEQDYPYEKKEMLELLNMALDFLDFEFREAFVLREYNDFSYQEIAEITGITLANAKSRVFRAKQKIKTILAPYIKDLYD